MNEDEKAKTFLNLFESALTAEHEFKEYSPTQYLYMLDHLNVDIELNSKGYVNAKRIQAMDDTARSFKQYLQTVWGKNALECFPMYYSKLSTAYDMDDKEIWLSPYMAWEYAVHQVRSVRRKQRQIMSDAISAKLDPVGFAKKEMFKSLKEEGYTDSEINEIVLYHFPVIN